MLIIVMKIRSFFLLGPIFYLRHHKTPRIMAKAKNKQPETSPQCCNEATEPYGARLSAHAVVYSVIQAYNQVLRHTLNSHHLGKYAVVVLLTMYYAAKPITMANIDERASGRVKVKANSYAALRDLIKLGYVIPTSGRKSKWGGMGYRYSLTISGRVFVKNNLVKPLIDAIA